MVKSSFCMHSIIHVPKFLKKSIPKFRIMTIIFLFFLIQRPEKYLGEIETWDKAEAALTEALNEFGKPWQVCVLGFLSTIIMENHSDFYYVSSFWSQTVCDQRWC